MADNVTFTLNADSTPPGGTVAATDELSDGSHAGLAKLLISADGSRTFIPATAADGLLVDVSNASIPVTVPPGAPLPVQISDGVETALITPAGQVTVFEAGPSSAAKSAVADNASDTLILASNAARLNFSVTNDSSATLFLSYGAVAASLTSYTVQIPRNSFYSDDSGFTGEVRGIWATDPGDGAARITELT